ncbi:hypothetical protein ACH4TX_15765 [Streptomyces sp. NPDC021098]|uniref:hypothetical protein n=1 Tax=unclassified Streptomyces TaxID=2593676 RepID=UPI003798A6F0
MSGEPAPTRLVSLCADRRVTMAISGERYAYSERLLLDSPLDIKINVRVGGEFQVFPTSAGLSTAEDIEGFHVTAATGLGKTQAAGHVVRQLLYTSRKLSWIAAQIEMERVRRAVLGKIAERLLASRKKDSGPPDVASVLKALRPAANADHCIKLRLLRAREAAFSRKIVRLRDLLNVILGTVHYEFTDIIPRVETSPCGVIRLAAPRVPRAPTAANDLLAPLRMRASAA